MSNINLQQQHQEDYLSLIADIDKAVESGIRSEEEGLLLKAQAREDLELYLEAAEHGYSDIDEYLGDLKAAIDNGYFDDELDEEDDAEYSASDDLSSFSSEPEDFGETILAALLEGYGEDQLEEGVIDLANAVGVPEEAVVDWLEGNTVPDFDLTNDIAEAFEIDDEDAYLGLHQLAAIDRGEDISDYFTNDEEEEEEDSKVNKEVLEYARNTERQAQMVQDRLDQAEFNAAIANTLNEVLERADGLLAGGYMTPKAYEVAFGNIEAENMNEQVATFKAYCEANEMDAESTFKALNLVLDVFEQCGRMMNYVQYSTPTKKEEEQAQFNAEENQYYTVYAKHLIEQGI